MEKRLCDAETLRYGEAGGRECRGELSGRVGGMVYGRTQGGTVRERLPQTPDEALAGATVAVDAG